MVPESERSWLLALLLVFASSSLGWWPTLIEPSFDIPIWLPFAVCAISAGAATLLHQDHWLAFFLASAAGALTGLLAGMKFFPFSDPESRMLTSLVLAMATALVLAANFAAALAAHCAPEHWLPPRLLWTTVGFCSLYPPVAISLIYLILIPPYHQRERLAEQRFFALKAALESAANDPSVFSCDPASWRRFHRGAPLPESAWTALGHRPALLDGYAFHFRCDSAASYDLHVQPARFGRDGGVRFCTNHSRCLGRFLTRAPLEGFCAPCRSAAPLPPPAPPPTL